MFRKMPNALPFLITKADICKHSFWLEVKVLPQSSNFSLFKQGSNSRHWLECQVSAISLSADDYGHTSSGSSSPVTTFDGKSFFTTLRDGPRLKHPSDINRFGNKWLADKSCPYSSCGSVAAARVLPFTLAPSMFLGCGRLVVTDE